jgi:hypothetical protein
MSAEEVVCTLGFISYCANRRNSPHIAPERWWRIGLGNAEMEALYQMELQMEAEKAA